LAKIRSIPSQDVDFWNLKINQERWRKEKEEKGKEGLGMVVHASNPSCEGGRSRRISVPRQKHETSSEKQTKAERAGGRAQMVELERMRP
jgi:hypothetical protein